MRLRTRQLVIVAALLAPAGGCNWMKEWRRNGSGGDDGTMARDAKDVTPERLVGYLNDRAARLQSIDYQRASMQVSGKPIPIPANLDGHLMSAQPRNFRLVGGGKIVNSKVIIGSNSDQFWMYVAAPGDEPTYVFASHSDFDAGRAQMPNNIPFEPDWVMQALGMTKYAPPPAVQYTVTPNLRERTYTLSWPATTPSKVPVVKEVVFNHTATGSRPVVRKHVIRDAKGHKEIASAEILDVETAPDGVVQYPTHVVLRWAEQDFKIDLSLRGAQVNQLPPDESARQAIFKRPDIPGSNPINLVRYAEFRPAK